MAPEIQLAEELFSILGSTECDASIADAASPPNSCADLCSLYLLKGRDSNSPVHGSIVSGENPCKIEAHTLRAFLLFLYGTGALVGEARRLLRQDLDFKRRVVIVRGTQFNRSREIPIGPDLYRVLRRYDMTDRRKATLRDPHFFLTKKGLALNERAVGQTFQRLRRMAGITRNDGGRFQPRMHDLRHTFAVHRLTAWIKFGADLNRMIPALSAYMGQVGLGSTDRYLCLTPERFRAQLDKLSPRRGKKRWRNNPALIKFLTEL